VKGGKRWRKKPGCGEERLGAARAEIRRLRTEIRRLKNPYRACPICTTLMPMRNDNGRLFVVCSKSCTIILMRWAQWMEAERGVDEAVVQRLICGSRVDSIKSERLEATRQLLLWGHSSAFIAMQLHTTQRSVDRYRRELLQNEVQV